MKFRKIWIILPIFVIFLVIGAISAKFVYDKIREPAHYTPQAEVTTPPLDTTSEVKEPPEVIKTVTPREPGKNALLPGAKWVPQTFNNCGPATTSMVLQYFGFNVSQAETKAHLRTNPDDKNVFTYEISDYLKNDYGIESKLLYGGDIQTLKKLLANGFYIVVEDWLHPNEDIGHSTIIRGYDDAQGVLIADDSYLGTNITHPYQEFSDTMWKAFNYEFLVVYKPGHEEMLQAIVGPLDVTSTNERAAKIAKSQIALNNNDMEAWFNLGTSLYALGEYKDAKDAFEKSQAIGWPKRMLWYQIQPIQTYNVLGEYQKAIQLSDLALWSNDSFAEVHLEKAIAYKGLGDNQKARDEANIALSFYPNFKKAQDLLATL